ncbi:MAG: hypothetical protein Fur002_26450 [Anaerolineales bacterium]
MEKRKKIFVFILIVIGAAAMIFFGMRAFRAMTRMRGHGFSEPPASQTDVSLIRDWMTVPYIARAYHVPPDKLFEELHISERENRKKSLKQINAELYPEEEGVMLARAQAAVLSLQAPTPPPAPHAP